MDEKEICMLFGQAIRRFRLQNKWTQESLAEKLDISANFLSNLENGKAWVSPKTVSKLAIIFNIHPHELFMPEHIMDPTASEILLRYIHETRMMVNMALDEVVARTSAKIGEP
jgi:transcriptional regulator with XRE-family HTH domain